MSSSSPGHGSDGLPVDTASGAAEGVARLRRSGFDLVVWDATLPESSDRARGRSLVPGNRPSVLFLITCGYLHTCLPELGGGEGWTTVARPFRATEILARAQVLLHVRRPDPRAGMPCHDDLVLDDVAGQHPA